MTVTVDFKTHKKRFKQNMVFELDQDDVDDIVFDYGGELGADTVSTASATTSDVTAGTPSISSNVVTVQLSGGSVGTAKMEMQITTAGGKTLTNVVRFKVKDYYS